jgi:hypothetical protein
MKKTYRIGFKGYIPLLPNMLVFKLKLSEWQANKGKEIFDSLKLWCLGSEDPKLQQLGQTVIFESAD